MRKIITTTMITMDGVMQALVSELRKIWHTINLFDIQKMQDFLNPKPAYSLIM